MSKNIRMAFGSCSPSRHLQVVRKHRFYKLAVEFNTRGLYFSVDDVEKCQRLITYIGTLGYVLQLPTYI